jgi:hypothetical protein
MIKVGGVRVKVDHVIWALFYAKDWKELFNVVSSSNSLKRTCNNPQCINPVHFKKSKKRGHINDDSSRNPTLTMDFSVSIEELLQKLQLEFSSTSKEVVLQYVSYRVLFFFCNLLIKAHNL